MAYLDDILVYIEESLEHHVDCVKKVLRRLARRDLKLNAKKCEFHKNEVDFLGFLIGTSGIKLDPAKVKSIKE